jgi:hypothetical protein
VVYGIAAVGDAVVVVAVDVDVEDVRSPSCCFNCYLNPCLKQTGHGIWVATGYVLVCCLLLFIVVVSVEGACRQMQLSDILDSRANAMCG